MFLAILTTCLQLIGHLIQMGKTEEYHSKC